MSRAYGMPYMGSKSRIAEKIIEFLPSAAHLYDLFMGGGAIVDCAAQSGKWGKVIGNELNPIITKTFLDATAGAFAHETRWISRKEFHEKKATDGYIALCWSFGNNAKGYLYGKTIEPYKKAVHYAIMFDDYSLFDKLGMHPPKLTAESIHDRCAEWRAYVRRCAGQTKSLESLESLEVYCGDYRDIDIQPDSVIYCDIPYIGRKGYDGVFDYSAFYDWCEKQTVPVYISSLEMPKDRFMCVCEMPHRYSLSSTNNACRITEKIFTVQKRARCTIKR